MGVSFFYRCRIRKEREEPGGKIDFSHCNTPEFHCRFLILVFFLNSIDVYYATMIFTAYPKE